MPDIPGVAPSELTLARIVVPARPRPEPSGLPWAEQHPVAASLEQRGPGTELIAALTALAPAELDDAALLEGVAAWERVSSWAAAHQAALLAELTRRATGSRVEFVADEVAARLAVSGRAADVLVERATALDALPEVHDALSTGSLDVRKSDLIVRETRHLPAPAAREVVRAVLDDAAGLTGPALRTAIRRAELTVDASASERRYRRARRERCVRMAPAPSSMAWLSAYLPATDATTVMAALDAVAARQAPGDERTADARRADALTDLMRQVLDTGVGPDGPLPTSQHRRPHLMVTASATSLAAALAGARRARRPTARPAADGLGSARDGGGTYCGALAELAGYGPIPIEHAMTIAAEADWRVAGVDPATGEVRARSSRAYRPSPQLTALVLDRDRTCTFPGCRIPAVRCDVDHVIPFDGRQPSELQTRDTNLEARCRHHHRMKTHGGWSSSRDPATGTTTWVSPTGRSYRRPPVTAALDPPLPAAAPAGSPATSEVAPTREPPTPEDEPPPF